MEDEKIDGQQEEEEETTMKMEKFYSLIRDFREARNRLLIRSRNPRSIDEEEPEKKKKKKRKKMDGDDQQQRPSWVPSFECEDFANVEIEVQLPATPLMLTTAPPCNTTGTTSKAKKIVEDDASEKSLDLRLTL